MPAGPRTGAARSLTIATLNTRGTPLLGTHRAERSAAVGAEFEHSPVEVVGFPEVHTYQHVRQPRAALPAFPHVAYARTPVGPAHVPPRVPRPRAGTALRRLHPGRRGHHGHARGADPRPADRDALRPRLRLRPPRPARGPAEDVEADAVDLHGFLVRDPNAPDPAEKEAALRAAVAAMGPPRAYLLGADGTLVEREAPGGGFSAA